MKTSNERPARATAASRKEGTRRARPGGPIGGPIGRPVGPCARTACALLLLAALWGAAPQSVQLQELRNRGKASFEEQRYAEAVNAFRAVAADPASTPQDDLNLAVALYRDDDDAGALGTLDAAREALAGHPGAWYLRGLIARRGGDPEAARAAFESARRLDPTDPAIRTNLGAVYAQLGMQDQAMQEFEAVIAMGFDVGLQHYVSSLYQHLQGLLRQGRRQEAEPEIAAYSEASRRLSQAARTAGALELSRSIAIDVPDLSIAPADPGSAGDVRFEAAESVEIAAPATLASGLALADINRDGKPDWLIAGPEGGIWLSDGAERVRRPLSTPAGAAGLGDFDRDGWPDLYVAAGGGDVLLRNTLGDSPAGNAVFAPVDTQGLPASTDAAAVLWVDFDHDGDLDVLVGRQPAAGSGAAPHLLRNLGGGAFEDATAASTLDGAGATSGAAAADFDGDYDVDLFLWGPGGTRLYSNQRGGNFLEVAAAVGARVGAATFDAVAEDLDGDGRIDLLLATADGVRLLRNLQGGTFRPVEVEALAGLRAAALEAADFNNDGYLDVVAAVDGGLRFFANGGGFDLVPFDPSTGGAAPAAPGLVTALAASDLDGDGGIDLLVGRDNRLQRFAQPAAPGRWLALEIEGIKNNVNGIGASVEVKTGGSYQLRPLRATPLHFGVGDAESIDVVRIRWPNGIVQNLLDVPSDRLMAVTELERLEGSCPFLYTWDGARWHFVNEVLGAAPLGMQLAAGVYHDPDYDEYVFVRGEELRPRDGAYEVRFTEELRETSFLDAIRLVAVDHPESLSLVADQGFGGPRRPDLRLYAHQRLEPLRARDQDGRDWSAELAAVDGSWAVPFEPGAYDGIATPHSLTLEPAAPLPEDGPVRLYLTGWVYWAMGSVSLAVDQDPGAEFTPVSLDVPDGNGGWRTAIEDIGLPTAKNTTLIVDVTDLVDRADPRVRLRTTMRLYWDAVAYSAGGPFPAGLVPRGDWHEAYGVPRTGRLDLGPPDGSASPLRVQVLAPAAAELRPRGFSKLQRTSEGFETFDYQTVVGAAPWEQHRGFFTRFGDVGELVASADDRYVVLGTGDETAIRFAGTLAPPPPGWRRDFLVYLNGWVKDTDLNTAYGDRVEPLPFHDMQGYPYPASQRYPEDPLHLEFLQRYLTRPPRSINTPLGGGR